MIDSECNITVVGLGLIGGSYAKAIRKKVKPKNLWAVDIDKKVLDYAEKEGIIDKGYEKADIPLKQSDIVIICIYPNLTINFIKENHCYFKSGAIITDTAGIKEKIVKEINSFLRKDLEFIGGHPMAGKESNGFKYASDEIFQGANYIVTPSNYNSKENIEKIKNMILKIGCKKIIQITPEEHDKVIAFTSHIPHILASILINNPILDNNEFCVGGSFMDATRVAKINSKLWSELLTDNCNNIVEQINQFEEDMEKIKRCILEKDKEQLQKIFDHSTLRRETLV